MRENPGDAHPVAQGFWASALLTPGAGPFCGVGHPVLCGVWSSSPVFHPLEPVAPTPTLGVTTQNVSRHFQVALGDRTALGPEPMSEDLGGDYYY